LAVKEAKALAKSLKKNKKRALKALIAAQAEQDEKAPTNTDKEAQAAPSEKARAKRKGTSSLDATQRVADSPEVVRQPRPKKKQPAPTASTVDPSATESSGALAEESPPSDKTVNSAD
jgi:hypothetical protein